jgi:hypothetical protein
MPLYDTESHRNTSVADMGSIPIFSTYLALGGTAMIDQRLYIQLAKLEQAALNALQECTTMAHLRAWRRRFIGPRKREEPASHREVQHVRLSQWELWDD